MKIQLPRSLPRGCGIALCVLAAVLAAAVSVCTISVIPPRIVPRNLDIAAASAHVVFDRPRPIVSDRLATDGDYQTLHKRTVLLGNLMTSAPALRHIARHADIDASRIAAVTRVTASVQAVLTEPSSERRASEIRESGRPYRLEIQPHPTLPTLDIYTQAPTVGEAQRLADAAVPGLRDLERELARGRNVDGIGPLRVEQLGPARGTIINGRATFVIAGLTFGFVLVMSAVLLLAGSRLRRGRRLLATSTPRSAPREPEAPASPAGSGSRPRAWIPAPAARGAVPAVRAPALSPAFTFAGAASASAPAALVAGGDAAAARRSAARGGDWPNTTRLLPWMVAAMMAIVWLVPFNVIELSVSLPIDLKFDRLVLPFVVGIWLLALAAGGQYAPRIRLTWIHVAAGALVALAFLSVVLEARQLNQSLELETAIKKLTLLVAYVSFFVVVASVVRRREIPAFMIYTLVLATLCALGTIWEYRFEYNVFYSLSDQVLPGILQVGTPESAAIDDMGRRIVRGPAELPLEAVAMLSMALPVALVGLIGATRSRDRILYGLAAALLLAGAVATYRKSAVIAPVSVVLTLAYFRRRELLRLAPLGVVVAILVLALSPGAVQSVVAQLSGDRLHAPTVSDRSSDYDAIRPDVWTHLLTGRGYGSYEHTSYRILDMELLRQLIEGGVVGLLAYVLMLGAVVAVARRPIRNRRPVEAPVALSAAAAAVGFIVVSMLFDVMSFPHTPYIVLFLAALLAVIVTSTEEERPAWS